MEYEGLGLTALAIAGFTFTDALVSKRNVSLPGEFDDAFRDLRRNLRRVSPSAMTKAPFVPQMLLLGRECYPKGRTGAMSRRRLPATIKLRGSRALAAVA